MSSLDPNKEEKINKHAELIEKDWKMLAVTAIEDKLQEQVVSSISLLRMANIMVWMLTGDKKETAINIGYACGLLDKLGKIYTLDDDSLPLIEAKIATIISDMKNNLDQNKYLIITGNVFDLTIKEEKDFETQYAKDIFEM